MNWSLLLQQCPRMSCLSHLNGLWDERQVAVPLLFWRIVCPGHTIQDSTQYFCVVPSSFFSISFVSVHVVHPWSSMDTVIALKKSCFILLYGPYFNMTNNFSITFHAFARHMLTSLLVDEMLLPKYVNWSTNLRGLPFRVKMILFCLKYWRSRNEPFFLLFALGYAVRFPLGLKCFIIYIDSVYHSSCRISSCFLLVKTLSFIRSMNVGST